MNNHWVFAARAAENKAVRRLVPSGFCQVIFTWFILLEACSARLCLPLNLAAYLPKSAFYHSTLSTLFWGNSMLVIDMNPWVTTLREHETKRKKKKKVCTIISEGFLCASNHWFRLLGSTMFADQVLLRYNASIWPTKEDEGHKKQKKYYRLTFSNEF